MLEHGCEAHNANARTAHTVVDSLIVDRIRRGECGQRAVQFGHIQTEAHLVQAPGASCRDTTQRKGPELGLRVRENIVHRRKLQEVLRIAWTEPQTFSAIDDGSTES